MKNTDVVKEFAVRRMAVFNSNFTVEEKDINNFRGKYLTVNRGDGAFAVNKYTNVFRFLDRVTQGVIHIINEGYEKVEPKELVARIYTFRLFNNLDTWERYPYKYKAAEHADDLNPWVERETLSGRAVYGRAYLLTSAYPYSVYSEILKELLKSDWYTLYYAEDVRERFITLHEYKGFGDFLAYQFALDFSYINCHPDAYNSFIVPGVGSIRGASRIFGKIPSKQLARIYEQLVQEWSDIDFYGWKIKGNDIQNVFCEFDKYSRVMYPELKPCRGKNRTNARRYRPTNFPYEIVFPRTWSVNFQEQ